MGVIFLEYIGGSVIYSCAQCNTPLSSLEEIANKRFTGTTGVAYLFNRVVNLTFSEAEERELITGYHVVRDVSCKKCDTVLGWVYEFAQEEDQRYKEGRFVLERALIIGSEGLVELKVTEK